MNYRTGTGPALTKRELAILSRLLTDPLLEDVRDALQSMAAAGAKGQFEQESLPKELFSSWPVSR